MKKNFLILMLLALNLASCGFESNRGNGNRPQKSSAAISSVEKKTLIIKLDPGKGVGVPETITVTAGEQYGYLPTPTLDGYEFEGWFLGDKQVFEYSFVNSAGVLVAHYRLKSATSWTLSNFTIQHDILNQSSAYTTPKIPVGEKLNLTELKKEYSSWQVNLTYGDRALVYDIFGDIKYTIELKNESGKVLNTVTKKIKGSQTSNTRNSCYFSTLDASTLTNSFYITFSTENIHGVGFKDILINFSFTN